MFKLLKTIWYVITGRLNKLSEVWGANPYAISAEYDSVVKDKQTLGNGLADAVGQIMMQQEKKKLAFTQAVEKIEKQSRLVTGALSKLKAYVAEQQKLGKSEEEITASSKYTELSRFYKDFSSTLKEQDNLKNELEKDLERLTGEVSKHEMKLKEINRDIKKVKDEKGEAIATILSAEAEKKINNAISNIGNDTTSNKLGELRDRVNKAKADAALSSRLSGADVANQEAEFLAAAESSDNDSELKGLLFGISETETEKTSEKVTVPAE
jgi:RNAse (barnase) inhibitor barstar